MARIPVAVIGVGHLGSRHARIYSELPGAELVAVADVNAERAQAVAGERGCEAATDYRALLTRIRAASVAVPTSMHREITLAVVEAGIDVLVEKPMATSLSEGREMVNAARRTGRVLAVGHTERYNPVVEALLLASSAPRFIEVHRLGSFSPRSLDIDVVLDLMIHDLDVVAALVRSPLASLEAVGVPVLTERLDIANARLRFANGCVANLTASRVSQDKVRKLRVFERDRYISVDYAAQEALSYRVVRNPKASLGFPEIVRESLAVEREEPLKRELADFLEAVATRRPPRVSGGDGLRALELARAVVDALEQAD